MPNPEAIHHTNTTAEASSPSGENRETTKEYFAVITDADFDLTPEPFENPRTRQGARGIILNDEGKIGVLHLSKVDAYKLIGGGLEEGEDPETAFLREVLEESGCKVEIDQYLGQIREEKSRVPFIQDSYVYVARVTEDTGKLSLTEKEKSRGAELLWLPLDEALEKVRGDAIRFNEISSSDAYELGFIPKRDLAILKHYQALTSGDDPVKAQ